MTSEPTKSLFDRPRPETPAVNGEIEIDELLAEQLHKLISKKQEIENKRQAEVDKLEAIYNTPSRTDDLFSFSGAVAPINKKVRISDFRTRREDLAPIDTTPQPTRVKITPEIVSYTPDEHDIRKDDQYRPQPKQHLAVVPSFQQSTPGEGLFSAPEKVGFLRRTARRIGEMTLKGTMAAAMAARNLSGLDSENDAHNPFYTNHTEDAATPPIEAQPQVTHEEAAVPPLPDRQQPHDHQPLQVS